MRSHVKGSLSAVTQVKVSSPEIILVAQGQSVHLPETSIRTCAKGECVSVVPGSKSAAGRRIDYVGTWDIREDSHTISHYDGFGCVNNHPSKMNKCLRSSSVKNHDRHYVIVNNKLKRQGVDEHLLEVGLIHSRGVGRVMPVEFQKRHPKGSAIQCKEYRRGYAIH